MKMHSAILALVMSMFASPSWAQQTAAAPFWVSVDFLNIWTAGPNSRDQVELFSLPNSVRQSGNELSSNIQVKYGAKYQSVPSDMGRDSTLLFSGGFRRPLWGVSARRWSSSGSWSYKDRIVSAPNTSTKSLTSTLTSQEVRGCRMWDHTIKPVSDMRDDSGLSPVNCYADNDLRLAKTDVVFERTLVENPGLQLRLEVGASFGSVANFRSEGQSMTAYVEQELTPPPIFLPASGDVGFPPRILLQLENFITLDSVSESKAKFVGPAIGLGGSFNLGPVRVVSNASSALMIGTSQLSGEWTDTDRNRIMATAEGNMFTGTEHYKGIHPFSLEERVVVPVLETHVKGSYAVTDNLSVGAGFFTSYWLGAPVAPSWSVPGEWRNDAGTHWEKNKSDVAKYGFSFSATYKFGRNK